MASKAEIQTLSKLKLKKFREIEGKFTAEGKRLVKEGVSSNFLCRKVLITNDFGEKENEFIHLLKQSEIKVEVISSTDLSKISSTKNPQGVVAIFDIPKVTNIKTEDRTIIGLENISDPGNLGTILRSCNWFGIKTVVLSEECADIYNPKVLRASMGAVFNLNIIEKVNLVSKVDELKTKQYQTYFADMCGIDYRKVNYKANSFIIFCNEAFGPSEEIKTICNNSITIPKKGNIDSLNVAAAAAVILSEIG